MNVGDLVQDATGDRGVIRRLGAPRAIDPDADTPVVSSGPAQVLVVWQTIDGVPSQHQASWEDVEAVTLIKDAPADANQPGSE